MTPFCEKLVIAGASGVEPGITKRGGPKSGWRIPFLGAEAARLRDAVRALHQIMGIAPLSRS